MARIIVTMCIAFLLVAGCAGSDVDPSGQPPGDPAATVDAGVAPDPFVGPGGGYIKLQRFTRGAEERTTGLAELYASHSGPGRLPASLYRSFPLDHCFAIPLLPAEPSFYDYVDVGPSIELREPGDNGDITMSREMLLNTTFYEAADLDAGIAGHDYQVTIDDQTASLRVPGQPIALVPEMTSGEVELGDRIELRWMPTGADFVLFLLQQGDVGRVCRLGDDGSFELPQEHAIAIPSYGTAVFMAINISPLEHDGRIVELVGVNGITASYER